MRVFKYPDHRRAALARRLGQDHAKPKLEALYGIQADRIQKLEDTLFEIHESAMSFESTGADLDRLGWVLGEARQGRTDFVYRRWLKGRAFVNRSAGRGDDLLFLLKLILGDEAQPSYTELPPGTRDAEAYVHLEGVTLSGAEAEQVVAILNQAKPSGVRLYFTQAAPATAFRFDTPGLGFGQGLFSGLV